MVAGIILLEQATLVELDTGHIGSVKYLDAGFELQGGDSLHKPLLFVRYFLKNNKLHTFSLSGWSHDLNRLLAVKEEYYESINF